MTPRTARLACGGAVAALALGLYARTLAPTVTFVDSGELIVAARNLGIGHPPGFPLYLMLAHLATYLPVGDVARRVNLASAVFAALAAGVLTLAVFEATSAPPPPGVRPTPGPAPKRRRRGGTGAPTGRGAPAPEPPKPTPEGPAAAGAAVLAGLLLAGSRTLWSYATVAEVYTLNTLLILVIVVLMLGWRRRQRLAGGAAGDRLLLVAAFTFGLALGNHHATVGLTLPALAFLVWATAGPRFFTSRRLRNASLVALAGLVLVYAYLPIAAARGPILNWGDPRTPERIWWHVTGRQYQVFLTVSADQMGRQAADFLRLLSREFGPPWLPVAPVLAGVGFVALGRRDRALAAFLGLVIAANLAYGLLYEIAEDKDAYYLPVFVALALAAGVGASSVLRVAARRASARGLAVAAGLLAAVPAVTLAANFPWRDRSRDFIARDYVENILATIEPGGLLLTADWQVASPMLYVQEVEARRPDAAVVDVNLLRRSWYFPYVARRAPDLLESNREAVRAFLEDLGRWEQDPEAYARDAALGRRISVRFQAMLLGFVRTRLPQGHAYVTLDILTSRDTPEGELIRALLPLYQLVPQGLVFELVGDSAFRDPAEPRLVTRGLADGTRRVEADDVVQVKVLPVYLDMLVNRGIYLALRGDRERAARAAREALALDPAFRRARELLARGLGPGAAPRP